MIKKLSILTLVLGIITLCFAVPAPKTVPVTLHWDAPTNYVDGTPLPTNIVLNYKLYYGFSTNSLTNSVSTGTNLIYTISNLTWGLKYYFASTALDVSSGNLESEYSNIVLTNLPKLHGPPKTALPQ